LLALRTLVLGFLLLLGGFARAAAPEELVRPIQERWAEIKYRAPENQRAEQFHSLAVAARALAVENPYLAEPLVWEGIVLAAEAEARYGLEAYWLARKGRESFDESLKLDERALNAAAYAGLARLHAQALLWPFGFGSKNKVHAEKYFAKSLAISPDGIDPNFFYGEYLLGLYRLPEARDRLALALKAPRRPGRELADSGRLEEIHAALAKIDKDLKIIARPADRR
jgi:hypothetical protein